MTVAGNMSLRKGCQGYTDTPRCRICPMEPAAQSMNPPFTYRLWELAVVVLVLNIPFGFWRGGVRKFTLPWFLAVHLPVPIVVGLRLLVKLGWHFTTFLVLVMSFFLGQFLGGKLRQLWQWRRNTLAAKRSSKS
jgi:hypothetical protein